MVGVGGVGHIVKRAVDALDRRSMRYRVTPKRARTPPRKYFKTDFLGNRESANKRQAARLWKGLVKALPEPHPLRCMLPPACRSRLGHQFEGCDIII